MYTEYTFICVGSHKKSVFILCKLLPFIKTFKRQPDDGTASGPKHVAVSQYNSCVERKSRFFQSVWICGLGYDPTDQEVSLISGMRKSIFSFTFTPGCGDLTASHTMATVVFSPVTATGD
jgi:hypothetical protein